jgi:diguanylate cyclase (GGDEF)-like protein
MENDVPSFSLVSRLRRTLWAMLLLPVAVGVAFFLFYSRQALQESAVRDLAAMLSLERQYIDVWVAERTADIRMLAADSRVLLLPPAQRREMLRAVLHGAAGFDDVVLADAHGRTVSDSVYPSGVDIADREYFRQPRDTGGTHLSDVLVSRRSGRRTIMISAPVLDEQGAFRGVVFGAMDLATITTLVETLQNESTGRTFLVQANGVVVSPIGQSPNLKPGDVIFDRARAGADSNGAYVNAEGRRVVGTYQWVNGGRWLLVAEKPELEILAVHAGALGAPLLGATLVFLLLGPAALRLTRSLREPMRRLEAHAESIQAGDYYGMDCDPAPKPGEPVEVQRLNRAYCLMVDRVRGTLEDLRHASLTDPLTGAANRKRLFSEGPRLMEAARRAGQPVSALMLDLDRFKAVNDTYGHAAGDAVLQVFARQLQGMLRQSDLFARYGGEEFVVLAPNAGGPAARELAERIRAASEGVRVDADGTELRFTVSVGASSLPPTGSSGSASTALETLLARADEALYVAKAAGRNRVEFLPLPVPAAEVDGAGP